MAGNKSSTARPGRVSGNGKSASTAKAPKRADAVRNKAAASASKPAVVRCPWPGDDPLYQHYHDTEWGVPVRSDRKLFEFLLLEGVQAGLSWITVLRKREAYRAAYDNFDWNKVAAYDEKKLDELMNNPGLVRNRLKIKASVTNAKAFIKVREEFGTFSKYIWSFVGGEPVQNQRKTMKDVPPVTDLATTISKDLKKRGFTFVGPTIVYAHMQATGMVNDHIITCFRHEELRT